MKCRKSCFIIIFLLAALLASGLYLTKKLMHPPDDSPIFTSAESMTSTPPYPPISELVGSLGQVLIVNTDPSTSCGPKQLAFSVKQLEALPQTNFKTRHTWSSEAQEFSGPLLADVLNLVCPKARDIYLRSLDQYSVMVNFSKGSEFKPILALKVDGKPLTVREKGPIWVMVDADGLKIPERSLDNMLVWQLYYIRILSSD